MRVALDDLSLDHLVAVYPGARAYPLAGRVSVLPMAQLAYGGHALIPARGGLAGLANASLIFAQPPAHG